MSTRAIEKSNVRWYREPWPWILLGLPATAVVAGIVTLVIAIRHEDGLVAEDYYRQGLAINRVLERESRAAELGLSAHLMFSGKRLRASFAGSGEFPDAVMVRFVHPTRAGEDREVALSAISPGWYEGDLPTLAAGRWRLQLEDAQSTWRLTGSWMTDQTSLAISAAAAS